MFKDRLNAGEALSRRLFPYKGRRGFLILAIPRGGVIVGKALSSELDLHLDVLVVRKVGAPGQPELAIGAVGPEETIVLDEKVIKDLDVEEEYIQKETEIKEREVKERIEKYRAGKTPLKLEGKSVILVDDGVATGATVEAAIKYLRGKRVEKLILAVPVAPKCLVKNLKKLVDEMLILEARDDFFAVGDFYKDFSQVTDEEVIQLLQND